MKTQCNALTSKKNRCSKKSNNNFGYCTIHTKMINNGKNITNWIDLNNIPIFAEHKVNLPNENKIYQIEIPNLDNLDNMDKLNKENELLDEEIDKEIEIIKSEETKNKIECGCCFEMYDLCNIVSCGHSNHNSCKECTKQYIINQINEKKQLICMFNSINKCGEIYNQESAFYVLSNDIKIYEQYIDYQQVDSATKIASVIDNYHICPFCSKWGIIVENQFPDIFHPQNIKNITCENCSTMFCINCRKEYHGNDTCNKIYRPNKDIIRQTIDRVIDDSTIHNCPKCFTKYSKEDGCNLMTCPSCKTYSCYLCNLIIKPLNGRKYWHFSNDKGCCPLYNHLGISDNKYITKGNINFNNTKVVESLKNLVLENIDNIDVKKMIISDIKQRGYKINV
jgi:hypothetical protein